MRLQIILRDERGDQSRIVPVDMDGEELHALTSDELWRIYEAMRVSLNQSFDKPNKP